MQNKQICSKILSTIIWTSTSLKKKYADFAIFFASQIYRDIDSLDTVYSKLNSYFEKNKISQKQAVNFINTYKYANKHDLKRIEAYLAKHQQFQLKKGEIIKIVKIDKLPEVNIETLEKKRTKALKINKEDFGYFLIPLLKEYYELIPSLEAMTTENITIHDHIWNLIDEYSAKKNEMQYLAINKSNPFLI